MLLPLGNPFKCHEEVLSLRPMIPPKRFDIFSSDWGVLRRSRCVLIDLLNKTMKIKAAVNTVVPDPRLLFSKILSVTKIK